MPNGMTPEKRIVIRSVIVSASVTSLLIGSQALASYDREINLEKNSSNSSAASGPIIEAAPNIVILRQSSSMAAQPAASGGGQDTATTQTSSW